MNAQTAMAAQLPFGVLEEEVPRRKTDERDEREDVERSRAETEQKANVEEEDRAESEARLERRGERVERAPDGVPFLAEVVEVVVVREDAVVRIERVDELPPPEEVGDEHGREGDPGRARSDRASESE